MSATTTQQPSAEEHTQTVHVHLQTLCTKLCEKVISQAEDHVKDIQEQYEREASRVLQALANRGGPPSTVVDKTVKKLRVEIKCTSGPHDGEEYVIHPHEKRRVPKLGRSTGKQFVKNGISLPEDGEVSTVHGRFDVRNGQLHFTDIGSTNGTVFKGGLLTAGDAVTLEPGDSLLAGQSTLEIVSSTPE